MEPKFLFTPGFLSQQLQRSVYDINEALKELGIEPCLQINDVAHYNGTVFFQLREHFKEQEGGQAAEHIRR
jgi:hypothetical protein